MTLYHRLMKWTYNFQGVSKSFYGLSRYCHHIYPQTQNVYPRKNSKGLCFGHCLAISFENHFQKLKSFERRLRFFVWHSFLFIWPQNFKRDHLASDRLSTILKYPLFKYLLPLKRKWNPMNVQSTHSFPMKSILWQPDMTHVFDS